MGAIGIYGGSGGGGGGLVDLAPVSTSSGTAHDVATALPDDVVYIAIVLDGVSANTANRIVLKLGTAQGIVSTGYEGIYTDSPDDIEGEEATSGFHLNAGSASDPVSGLIELRRIGDSNKWRASGRGDDGLDFLFTSGTVTLSARLTKVQVTLNSISGTNAFDAGQVSVQYSTRKGVGPIASTANLPEGGSGPYYFTDARARGAVSADSASFLRYNSTTGVFSVDGTAFNAAADARIAAASIGDLSDVSGSPSTGDILVRGSNSYAPAGIETLVKFAEGSNVTISTAVSDSGVLTATFSATGGGGGGGISTISAASDTNFASLQQGNVPVYNSTSTKWNNEAISDLVGISNTGANVTLATAMDGGVLSISANVGGNALALSTISAGGATAGHVLTVSSDGNSISAAAQASGGVSIEQVHDAVADDIVDGTGLTKTKNDSANTVTLDLDSAGTALGGVKTGGPFTFTSGTGNINDGAVTAGMIASGVIPQKASASELGAGTNDSNFVTPAGVRSMERSFDDGTTWSGFTYVSGTPSTGQFGITGTNSAGWTFTFATTDANATQMDAILGRNSHFIIDKDASNRIVGEVDYAWRDGNSMSFKAKANATETGDIRSGNVSLQATGGLYEDLRDQGFAVKSDLVQGTNITLTTGSDGRITIAATATGGGGSVTFATQAEVNAGTVNDEAVAPDTLRGLVATEAEVIAGTNTYKSLTPSTAHNLIEHLAHVATYSGFQNASSANDLPVGRWHINSNGTTAYFRGHTEAEAIAMTREFLVDRYFILRNSTGQRIEAKFSNVVSVAVSGSNIGILQCTIGDHSATPASPTLTGDWSLTILPEQNEQILENAPKGSIPLIAMAAIPGAVGFNATGGANIGSTFGSVSNWTSNDLAADNSNFMILPHPDQSTTPAGTGEMTFTPLSARDSFMCFFDVGFGWVNHNSRIQVNVGLVRKIGNGGWTFVAKKTNIINEAVGNNNDKTIGGFALDSPNTTSTVTYRWVAVKTTANANRIFPVAQSVAAIHIPAI